MKNIPMPVIKYSTFLIAFFLFGAIVPGWAQAALSLPETVISHVKVLTANDSRLAVSATVQDSAGIIAARCYFRYDSSVPYIYSEMNRQDTTKYTAELPYPAEAGSTLDFILLSVNENQQVVVSSNYQSLISKGAKGDARPNLQLYSETISYKDALSLFADHEHITIHETPVTNNYGVLAGLYDADQVRGHTVSGYFGAFTSTMDGTMTARRGLAISLDSSDIRENNFLAGAARVDLSGKYWAGEFYRTDDYEGTQQDITASITQNGSYVVVVTTSLEGLGHQLVGKIYSNNHLLLYDQYDGEDWTTHYGPASDHYVLLADYVWNMHGHPLNMISLHRATFDPHPTPVIKDTKNLPALPTLLLKQ